MEKELNAILKFIATSDFRLAPNPPKYIIRGYVNKTKSTIQWDDFLRIIMQLEKDGHLIKSTGPHGEDCYAITYTGKQKIESPQKGWKKITKHQWGIILTIVGIIVAILVAIV